MARRKPPGTAGKGYDTPEDAATAAMQYIRSQPSADRVEYAAGIWQDPETGKYYRTHLATNRSRGGVSGEAIGKALNKLSDLGGLRAMVHNHPNAGPSAEYFSEDDLAQIKSIEKQIKQVKPDANFSTFLEALPRNNRSLARQRRLDPNNPGRRHRHSQFVGIEGEEFLAQFPIEEFSNRLARKFFGRPQGLRRDEEVVPTRGARNILAGR